MTIKRSAAGVRLAPWQSLLLGVTLLALAWHLRFAAMLIFGAVLVAATLDALAAPVQGTDRLRRSTSLIVVIMVIVAFAGGVVWWFGTPVVDQLASLSADIPHAWTALRSWLENSLAGAWLLTTLRGSAMAKLPLAGLADVAGVTVQAISAGILVVLMGLYLAFDIELYERGLIRLFPLRLRERVEGALNEAGTSLRRWLVGQAVAMLAVGTSVTIGLLLLDVPLALALGLVAAVLEFIPFFGPIASGALAVLVAFAQGPHLALYVAVLFIVIQQLESNVLVPIVQRWAVRLPPVLSVAGVIVFGSLFGIAGVIFGTPLMVVAMVPVRRLWVMPLEEESA